MVKDHHKASKLATTNAVKTRCGYIAIVGRPNVGKSTLLNHLIGQKISITSRKPQTTQHHILGIKTTEHMQAIFIDTPGLNQYGKKAAQHTMNRTAQSIINEVDIIIFMVEKNRWHNDDDWILKHIKHAHCPVILAINKIDRLRDTAQLLPYLDRIKSYFNFTDMIPLSATKHTNIDRLENRIHALLPFHPYLFPSDQITDRSERFMAQQWIREKIMRQLGHELPYEATVSIERFQKLDNLLHIDALIFVERNSQKAIIIGQKGSRLQKIGHDARIAMEAMFSCKVMLKLWVKVKQCSQLSNKT